MSRKGYRFSAAIVSLLLVSLLTACGSSKKEGGNAATVARVDEASCRVCHSTSIDPVSATQIVPEFLGSAHNAEALGCQGCHGGGAQHNGVGPIPFPNPLTANRCVTCHTDTDLAPLFEQAKAGFLTNNCSHCHTSSGVGSVHAAQVTTTDDCLFCHAVAAPQHGAELVGDNNGVRAVVAEFSKWSHHVTGTTLQNAHCAACHLEGAVGTNGAIVIDHRYHMVDSKTHLRNADTDADLQWDPNVPDHGVMDTFCMRCHDANGAVSTASAQIRAVITPAAGQTASALNPFGDTISNRYDKMARIRVIDVDNQFNTGNFSHHAVKGKKYSGSLRGDGIAARTVNSATFTVNSSAALPGARATLRQSDVLKTFAAGEIQTVVNANPTNLATFNLNTMYQTLTPAAGTDATLGDDSPLHCADCHTVGQYAAKGTIAYNNAKAAYAAYTSYNRVAIGAHGSNNEYLLRNSKGTDALHGSANYNLTATAASGNAYRFSNPNGNFLVCFNCHAFQTYGSVYGVAEGPGHAGEYAKGNRCNGENNTYAGYTTGTLVTFAGLANFNKSRLWDPTQANSGSAAGGGNIFAFQCANCHNSGPDNRFGGIHGSSVQTYPDANNVQQPARRFLSGLGNWKHVPSGSVNTVTNIASPAPDTGWEMEASRTGEGCYTLSSRTTTVSVPTSANASGERMLGTWGACTDHGGTPAAGINPNTGTPNTYVTGGDTFERKIIRPVNY
jgi:hypothetical protein